MSEKEKRELNASETADRRILWMVLLINLAQSAAGFGVGLWAASTAVLGAALDNLGDTSVYSVSLSHEPLTHEHPHYPDSHQRHEH